MRPDHPHVVTVDGAEYRLHYDLNSLALFEESTGVNLLMAGLDVEHLPAKHFGILFFAGIQKHHPEITVDQVFAMLRPDNIVEALTGTLAAYANAMPEPGKDKKKVRPPRPVEASAP